jgi:predicted XRE-type DNA-binding protein
MKSGSKKTTKKHDEPVVERSSGNVFADLGYPNPEEALAKARLSSIITDILRRRGLTQTQAAKLLGIDQPKVSRLMRGRVREFSLERLIHFLGALDRRVDIVIHSTKRRRKKDYLSVIAV